jgi:VanZ family protein
MIKVIRLAGLLAIVSIGFLSVVPGEVRPHVLASGQLEHFGAYGVAGFILGFGYFGRLPLLRLGVGLTVYASVLEVAQLFIPGRSSRLADFCASSLGAWTGIILVLLLYSMLGRKFISSAQ